MSLNVTVTEAGHYVTDLEEEDFEVFEDGVKQKTTFFSKEQQPIALAVLLDTSASMDEQAGDRAGSGDRLRAADAARTI